MQDSSLIELTQILNDGAVDALTFGSHACQASVVGLIVNAYLSLEASSSSILSGSQALADALVVVDVSYTEFRRRRRGGITFTFQTSFLTHEHLSLAWPVSVW